MHYILVDGICEDKDEDYKSYEQQWTVACRMLDEEVRFVKRALDSITSGKRTS